MAQIYPICKINCEISNRDYDNNYPIYGLFLSYRAEGVRYTIQHVLSSIYNKHFIVKLLSDKFGQRRDVYYVPIVFQVYCEEKINLQTRKEEIIKSIINGKSIVKQGSIKIF